MTGNTNPKKIIKSINKKTRFQRVKEKQLWTVVDRMKAIFSDESPVLFGQCDDAGTFVWCHSIMICMKMTT